jgi:hypothetical protein
MMGSRAYVHVSVQRYAMAFAVAKLVYMRGLSSKISRFDYKNFYAAQYKSAEDLFGEAFNSVPKTLRT